MIDRQSLRSKVCLALKTDYVALLGQRGIGVRTIIDIIMSEGSPFPGMKFIHISLPLSISDPDAFSVAFLKRLTDAVSEMKTEPELTNKVLKVLKNCTEQTADTCIIEALDALGKGFIGNYLVIVLHDLARVSEEPLKNLLRLLRDYHNQRSSPAKAGKKLRFLVAGGARLWRLCSYNVNVPDDSPFNIAKRIFIGGLSPEEIQKMDSSENFEAAVKLRDLTDGVPSLVEQAINTQEETDDLSPFFRHLQKYWKSLPVTSQEALKSWVLGLVKFPDYEPDSECPEIPEIGSPWMEAFWAGFLRMRRDELTWRSPIHRAFLMEHAGVQDNISKSALIKVDLLDRVERLEKALNNTNYSRHWIDNIEEALSLAIQINDNELASILRMLQNNESEELVLKRVEQLAVESERGWIKDLAWKASQHKNNIGTFLIKGIILGTKRSRGNYDVFLCHNKNDKHEVKQIGEKLIEQGILPWLDEWELRPGEQWQRILEHQIGGIKTAAVFVGKNGMGPWQQMEEKALLSEFVDRECRVIPVLLSDAPSEPQLPIFLKGLTWVDFRKDNPDPMDQLIWGIIGKHGPGK